MVLILKSNDLGYRYDIGSPDIFSKTAIHDLVGNRATGKRLNKFLEELVLLAITEIKHGSKE